MFQDYIDHIPIHINDTTNDDKHNKLFLLFIIYTIYIYTFRKRVKGGIAGYAKKKNEYAKCPSTLHLHCTLIKCCYTLFFSVRVV